MNERPLVSVVIPVYNTREYLPACLESVLSQTMGDFELLLVDDGSTDGSLEVEEAYAARDGRVRVLRQQHARQGAARNLGMREARGEYVYFLDSDDLIDPTLLETACAACEAGELDFVTFDSVGFLDDPDEERTELFSEICDRRALAGTGVCDGPTFWGAMMSLGSILYVCGLIVFRRTFLLDNELFFVEGIYYEDTDWVLRVYLAAKRLKYLPEKLHRYRRRSDSTTHAGFNQALAESCFEMYDLLMRLYAAQMDDARRQMVHDTMFVLCIHIDNFATFEPEGAFVDRTAEFVHSLACDILLHDESSNPGEPYWALTVIVHLERALAGWSPAYQSVVTPELLQKALFGTVFMADPVQRIGIYGTGKVCDLLLRAFGGSLQPAVLFETDPPHGKTAYGIAVASIADALSFDLDTVLVASTRYQDQMVQTAQAAVGDGVKVLAVSRAILRLDGWVPLGNGDST